METPTCGPRHLSAPLLRGLASCGDHAGYGIEAWPWGKSAASSGHGRGCSAGGRAAGRAPLCRHWRRGRCSCAGWETPRSSAAKHAALEAAVNQPRFPDLSVVLRRPIRTGRCAGGCRRGAAALAGHGYFRAGRQSRASRAQPLC